MAFGVGQSKPNGDVYLNDVWVFYRSNNLHFPGQKLLNKITAGWFLPDDFAGEFLALVIGGKTHFTVGALADGSPNAKSHFAQKFVLGTSHEIKFCTH